MNRLGDELHDNIFMAVCQSISIAFGISYKDTVTIMNFSMEPLRKIAAYNVFRELNGIGDTKKASAAWALLNDREKEKYNTIARERNDFNMGERIDIIRQMVSTKSRHEPRRVTNRHYTVCECGDDHCNGGSKRGTRNESKKESYDKYVKVYHRIITQALKNNKVNFVPGDILSILGYLRPYYVSCKHSNGSFDTEKFNDILNGTISKCIENRLNLSGYVQGLKASA